MPGLPPRTMSPSRADRCRHRSRPGVGRSNTFALRRGRKLQSILCECPLTQPRGPGPEAMTGMLRGRGPRSHHWRLAACWLGPKDDTMISGLRPGLPAQAALNLRRNAAAAAARRLSTSDHNDRKTVKFLSFTFKGRYVAVHEFSSRAGMVQRASRLRECIIFCECFNFPAFCSTTGADIS